MSSVLALFVLLPANVDVEALVRAAPAALQGRLAKLQFRRYPRADDGRHLASLVRAMHDPVATTWRAGTAKAILLGAVLGAATNGVLAGAFDMFGGLVAIAVPLGFGVGAFLGSLTAAMTGTATPREEVRQLLTAVRPGDVLVTWAGRAERDHDCLAEWRQLLELEPRGLRTTVRVD